MTKFNYSAKMNQESCVKASGQSLPISLKHSVEICNFVRGKSVEKALKDLEQISLMKIPLAFKKFKHKVGHRKGNIAAGRYPIKAIGYILNLIKSAENNAIFKGMNSKNLTITHMCSHKASRSYHYSRHRGRLMKRTHVEIILTEKEIKVKNQNQ